MQEKVQKKTVQLKRQKANRPEKPSKLSQKLSGQKVVTIIASTLLVLAHIAILLAILWSWRYYSIYPSLFGSVVAIILSAMVIIDIIFFVGFNHKDVALKIISTVMAVLLLVGGTVGSVAFSRANKIVDNVLDNGSKDKYETFSGVFVYYRFNKGADNFKELKDLSGKKIGMLVETTNGLSYIATNLLSKEKIDYATVEYKTNAEMMQGLLDGDVDAIVITSAYRSIYKGVENTPTEEGEEAAEPVEVPAEAENPEEDTTILASTTEESPFAKYLPDLVDFYSFQQDLKTNVQRSNKNLSTDPFNVLLIGYSRTEIGSTVGLADSIILATINPQTYEVSMTSIARDSFVPIACYGGEYDKINSGRSTSRACFIETVENFLNMDIDYYMELDYLGLVQIVDVIGGVVINNPVDFTLDGIYVPAGTYEADGQQALQFCRERHHMPGGDFSRQQHQKEVIMAIAKKFVEKGSVSLALKAMDQASQWMSTDMTLSQLTSVFNLLLNTKNFTTLDTFDLVDFQNTRITGNGGLMYYSYSMRLPLWVYLIYQGSYDETMNHLNEVMGNYKTYNQKKNHVFSLDSEYVRPALYSTEYSNTYMFTPDPMPAYWASLTDMTVSEAVAWANANHVSLSVNYIKPGDADYDESLGGSIVSQTPRYGALVSEYPSGSINVMAVKEVDPDKQVPDFIEHNYTKAKEWAKEHDIDIKIHFDTDLDGKVGDVVRQNPAPYTDIAKVDKLEIWVKAGVQEIRFNKNGHGSDSDVPGKIEIITGDDDVYYFDRGKYIMPDVTENGDTYEFLGWFTDPTNGSQITNSDQVSGNVTLYAHWEKYCNHEWGDWVVKKEATCEEAGSREHTCSKCGKTESEEIAALGHDMETITEPTCEASGKRRCRRCGKEEDIPALGHSYTAGSNTATCTEGGSITYTCSRCGNSYSESTSALGHDYIGVQNEDGTTTYTCSRCGDAYTE